MYPLISKCLYILIYVFENLAIYLIWQRLHSGKKCKIEYTANCNTFTCTIKEEKSHIWCKHFYLESFIHVNKNLISVLSTKSFNYLSSKISTVQINILMRIIFFLIISTNCGETVQNALRITKIAHRTVHIIPNSF